MARQCPHCPLLFDLAPMLADHLATDHAIDEDQLLHLKPAAQRVGTRAETKSPRPSSGRRLSGDGGPDTESTDGA